MMDGSHQENALARQLEPADLDDDRHDLHHEQPADDGEHDLVLGGNGDRTDQAAKSERTRIAHENCCRRSVKPQEAETSTDHCAEYDRELTCSRSEVDLEIVCKNGVTRQVG